MKNWLSNATKKRVIEELKKFLYEHPRYREDSENVRNKFGFKNRPQRGIIINNTSADRVRLAADNYIGRLSSFVMLAPVKDCPGTSLEWARENFTVLERFSRDRSVFPSPPGVYIIEITKLPDEARNIPGLYTIDPILTVMSEPLIRFRSSADYVAQLSHEGAVYPGSCRLLLNNRRALVPDVDYHIEYPSGAITFLKPTPTGMVIFADYRYQTDKEGPFRFQPESVDVDAIPGAVIAFGDRVQKCDQMAVVTTSTRAEVAEIYGGKFEVTFQLIVFTRDTDNRERMSDYIIEKVLENQNRLGFEGLELMDINPTGETEEVYNAETDEYYYENQVTMSLRVDWEIQIPMPVVINRLELTSRKMEQATGYLDGMAQTDLLQAVTQLGIQGVPVKIGKKLTYERVI